MNKCKQQQKLQTFLPLLKWGYHNGDSDLDSQEITDQQKIGSGSILIHKLN